MSFIRLNKKSEPIFGKRTRPSGYIEFREDGIISILYPDSVNVKILIDK